MAVCLVQLSDVCGPFSQFVFFVHGAVHLNFVPSQIGPFVLTVHLTGGPSQAERTLVSCFG